MRATLLLTALLTALTACGGSDSPNDTSGTTVPTVPGGGGDTWGAGCTAEGTVEGCLLYESEDCENDTSLDGLPGGWFRETGSTMEIGLAPLDDGIEVRFVVSDASLVTEGAELDIPTVALASIEDRTDPTAPVSYYACPGLLRVTSYTPGDLMWGTFAFGARGPSGLCGVSDYYSVQGSFNNIGYCDA